MEPIITILAVGIVLTIVVAAISIISISSRRRTGSTRSRNALNGGFVPFLADANFTAQSEPHHCHGHGHQSHSHHISHDGTNVHAGGHYSGGHDAVAGSVGGGHSHSPN